MELWQEMIITPWWKSIFFLFSTIASSLLTSRYLQMWKIKEFDKDMAIYACLTSLLFLIFFFGTFWWSFPSAVLSGIIGTFLWTNKVI